MSKFSLKGKHALITGAGSGIGESIARTFAEAGATVYVLDIRKEEADAVAKSIQAQGFLAIPIVCDVSDHSTVSRTMQDIDAKGSIDILVNNAGIASIGTVENTKPSEFKKVMDINVGGIYNCINACAPLMKASGGGVILNIASTVATVAIKARFAYSTSKGAVLAMTYSVALDLIEDGIRCNALSPGRVHTPFVDQFIAKNYPGQEKEMFKKLSSDHPIGRMAKPQEVANTALFLCSDEASYVTGSNYHVDGGFTRLITN